LGRAQGAGESGISAAGDAGGVADWTPRDDREPLVKRGKVALGQAVRYGRRSLGVSQDTFGIHAGVSQPVISRLETGRLNGIRWQTLARVIGLLDAAGVWRLRHGSDGSDGSDGSARPPSC